MLPALVKTLTVYVNSILQTISATMAQPTRTSMRTAIDMEKNKDDVLLSIYDILSQIETCFPNGTDKYDDISAMAELKKHSTDLLNYMYSKEDGNTAYVCEPKLPAALGYNWLRMLLEVEEDITAMRGYLCGLPLDYHVRTFSLELTANVQDSTDKYQVVDIRSLRNRARGILKAAPSIPKSSAQSHANHNPYQVPYQPPTGATRAKPLLMMFNDDEMRYYYEGIPVPETEMEREKAKAMYKMRS